MNSNGNVGTVLDETTLNMYDGLPCNTYEKSRDILDDLGDENIADQNMPDFGFNEKNVSIHTAEFNDAPIFMDDILQQFEKDMGDRITAEVEDHKGRIFEILSNYKDNIYCALEQNVPDDSCLTPMNTENQLAFTDQSLGTGLMPATANFPTEQQSISNAYLEREQIDIECSIDRQLLEIVATCFQVCRQLDSHLT